MDDPEDLSRPFLEELLALLQAVEHESTVLARATATASRLALVSGGAAGLAPLEARGPRTSRSSLSALPAAVQGVFPVGAMEGPSLLPLWGCLRRDSDVERFAGSARVPAIVLPVELSLVANKVQKGVVPPVSDV